MTSASARLEVRVRPETKSRIEHAAALLGLPVSDFVRTAVEECAARIVAEHQTSTRVDAVFYDDIIAALDESAQPASALVRAAERAKSVVSSS